MSAFQPTFRELRDVWKNTRTTSVAFFRPVSNFRAKRVSEMDKLQSEAVAALSKLGVSTLFMADDSRRCKVKLKASDRVKICTCHSRQFYVWIFLGFFSFGSYRCLKFALRWWKPSALSFSRVLIPRGFGQSVWSGTKIISLRLKILFSKKWFLFLHYRFWTLTEIILKLLCIKLPVEIEVVKLFVHVAKWNAHIQIF